MVSLTEGVNIPFFSKYIDESGKFNEDEIMGKFADGLFRELLKWTVALKAMREKAVIK
jgi:hypothetical protein